MSLWCIGSCTSTFTMFTFVHILFPLVSEIQLHCSFAVILNLIHHLFVRVTAVNEWKKKKEILKRLTLRTINAQKSRISFKSNLKSNKLYARFPSLVNAIITTTTTSERPNTRRTLLFRCVSSSHISNANLIIICVRALNLAPVTGTHSFFFFLSFFCG